MMEILSKVEPKAEGNSFVTIKPLNLLEIGKKDS